MSEPANVLVPVLDQVIEFMESALKEASSNHTQIVELTEALKKSKAEQERVILEKVAHAKAEFFDKEALQRTLNKLTGMGVLDSTGCEKIARRVGDDPNFVLPLIVKIAESLMSAPGDGEGISKLAESMEEADPDGWSAMAQGKPVSVRK